MLSLISSLQWLRRLWTGLRGRKGRIPCLRVEDLPENLDSHIFYIVFDSGRPWHASMSCPCGCGEAIHLNLLPDERPRWQIQEHFDGTASATPSIWRTQGCRSHFWLQRGRIMWAVSDRSD